MNTYTGAQVAGLLGTSRKRVQSAAKGLGFTVERDLGVRTRFTSEQVERLAATLGVTPPVDGLTRIESLVLSVLSRRPLGLVSKRAVARACSLSPASAVKAVNSLQAKGLVTVEESVRALGQARQVTVVRANNQHPNWSNLLAQLQHVQPPIGVATNEASRLPDYLRHAFWNVDDAVYETLNVHTHGTYIVDRALTTNDPNLAAYVAANAEASAWRDAAEVRGRDARDKALAGNIAHHKPGN